MPHGPLAYSHRSQQWAPRSKQRLRGKVVTPRQSIWWQGSVHCTDLCPLRVVAFNGSSVTVNDSENELDRMRMLSVISRLQPVTTF